MDKTKRKIIHNIISVIIYILIVSFLSIDNIVPDAMFLVGFITIISSTFLFLLKINLDKMKQTTVIGARTMRNGITHTFAQSGFTVFAIELNTLPNPITH